MSSGCSVGKELKVLGVYVATFGPPVVSTLHLRWIKLEGHIYSFILGEILGDDGKMTDQAKSWDGIIIINGRVFITYCDCAGTVGELELWESDCDW